MTTAATRDAQLDRGFVQSQVIESNLEHLRTILSEADVELRDDLKSFTRTFGLYVDRLGDACTRLSPGERTTDAGPLGPLPAAASPS